MSTLSPSLVLLLAAVLLPGLNGCSGVPARGSETGSAVLGQADGAAPERAGDDAADQDDAGDHGAAGEGVGQARDPDLPRVPLTGDLLFHYLLGQVAAQRGQTRTAVQELLAMAHATGDVRFATEAVHAAARAEDLEQALRAARAWHSLRPDDEEAVRVLSSLLLEAGEDDEAVGHLVRLAGTAENPELFVHRLVGVLARRDQPEAGLALMRRLVAALPDVAQLHLGAAVLAQQAGEVDLAVAEAQRAHQLRPDDPQPMEMLGRLLRQRDPRRSADLLGPWIDGHPDQPQVRLLYAGALLELGEVAQAREQFEVLAAQRPDDADISFALGLLALEARRFGEAETYLRQAAEQGFDRPDALRLQLARSRALAGDRDAALEALEAIGEGGEYLNARLLMASILDEDDRLEEALAVLRAAAGGEDANLPLLRAQARLLRQHGRHQEAFDLLSSGLSVAPDDPDLLYDRALVAESLDRVDLAEADLRRVIELQPDSAQAYNALGYTLADRTDRLDEAVVLLDRAIALKPDDPYIQDSVGWLAYRQGRLEEALEILSDAYQRQPDPEIAAHLGEVLWKLDRKEEARAIWERAQGAHPDNAVLRATVERFREP